MTYRDLTDAELNCWFDERKWPCCGGQQYRQGPRGGLMMNVECPVCGTIINVPDPSDVVPFRCGQMISEPPGYKPPPLIKAVAEPEPTPPIRDLPVTLLSRKLAHRSLRQRLADLISWGTR